MTPTPHLLWLKWPGAYGAYGSNSAYGSCMSIGSCNSSVSLEALLLMAPMGQMALVCPTAPIVYVDGNDSDRFYGSIAPGGP